MPNVLKVFLENGQTKSFKYDSSTTVRVSVTHLLCRFNVSQSTVNKQWCGVVSAKKSFKYDSSTTVRVSVTHLLCRFNVSQSTVNKQWCGVVSAKKKERKISGKTNIVSPKETFLNKWRD